MAIKIILISSFFMMTFFIFSSCKSDLWNLGDRSNERIPNYSITMEDIMLGQYKSSQFISITDDQFLTAIQLESDTIELLTISQEFENENWQLIPSGRDTLFEGTLLFFEKYNNDYILGYNDLNDVFHINILDEEFRLIRTSPNYEIFADTFYNATDSLELCTIDKRPGVDQLLLGGKIFTQGTHYSMILCVDNDLKPLWLKTYFENSEVIGVTAISQDSFLLLNTSAVDGSDLILDNTKSSIYKKYNLSSDQLFIGDQQIFANSKIQLIGTHNNIGRIIEVDLESASAFINEIEVYPVTDLKGVFLKRDKLVVVGRQIIGSGYAQFTSELFDNGAEWCHIYPERNFVTILDIIEMPERGMMVCAIVELNGKYHLHLTRIDEEGATFVNEFTENCL